MGRLVFHIPAVQQLAISLLLRLLYQVLGDTLLLVLTTNPGALRLVGQPRGALEVPCSIVVITEYEPALLGHAPSAPYCSHMASAGPGCGEESMLGSM